MQKGTSSNIKSISFLVLLVYTSSAIACVFLFLPSNWQKVWLCCNEVFKLSDSVIINFLLNILPESTKIGLVYAEAEVFITLFEDSILKNCIQSGEREIH